jgi:hypothetical protein
MSISENKIIHTSVRPEKGARILGDAYCIARIQKRGLIKLNLLSTRKSLQRVWLYLALLGGD